MRYAAALVVASWLITLVAPFTHAQDSVNLPAGIITVEIAGQALDGATTPTVGDPAPQITGRVELGASVITLTLTGDTPLQFSTEVDNRGRFRIPVPQPLTDGLYTLAINDLPVGSFQLSAGAAPADRVPGPLLDIARVVPYPADFGNAIPGIGFLDGRFYTIEEEAARTAASGQTDPAAVRNLERRLAEAGWLQRYESRLAAPHRDDTGTFRVQFSSFVVEYASGEAAQAAFATLRNDGEEVDAPLVGDESAVTLMSGVTPDTGAEYQAARLVFRIGPMLAVIVYADLTNEPPDLALLDTVAQNVAGRAAVVAARDTVPLGSMILRLDPATATGTLTRRDVYDVRAGTLTTLFGEDDATRAARIAVYTGTTDALASTTGGAFVAPSRGRRAAGAEAAAAPAATSVIQIEGDTPAESSPIQVEGDTPAENSVIQVEGDPPPETAATPEATAAAGPEDVSARVVMASALYAFPGPSEADVWLTSQEQTLASDAETHMTFEPVAEGPSFGDASATFATEQPFPGSDVTATGYRIYTRVGEIVAVLEFMSQPGVQLNGASRLMRMQVDCILDEGCTDLAPLPLSLFGGQDEPVSTEPRRTRRAEQPTPVPTAEPAPVVIEVPPPAVEEVVPVEEPPPPVEQAPVEEAPVEAVPIEELAPPEEAPVEEPIAEPTVETAPPAEEATPPGEETAPPPGEETAPPPAEATAPPPAEATAPPPAEATLPPPAVEPTPAPVEPTAAPVEEPIAVPTEAPAPPPAEEPIAIPTPAPDTSVDEGGGEDDDDRGRRSRRERRRDRRD